MKNSSSLIDTISIFFQRCWLVAAIVAIVAMVWLADEPAWAGPQQQFTVPTATPTAFDTPDEELVPTPTPEPLFEPEDDNSDDFDSTDDFDLPVEEPTEEPFFQDPPQNEEPDALDENLFDDFESDDDSATPPQGNDDTVDTSFEDTLPDNSFDPVDNPSDANDFADDFNNADGTDDFATGEGAAGGGGSAGGGTSGTEDGTGLDDESTDGLGPESFGSGNIGTVAISVLNLRRGPSPDSAIIDTMWRNDTIEISQTANDGTWLLVCCGVEEGSAGWVSSLFINYDANSLTVGSLDGSATSAAVDTTTETASDAETSLELTMRVTDTTVLAGQILDINYEVENLGSADALNVSVTNELPEDLYLNNFEMDATGQFTHTLNAQNNRRIFTIIWPEIAASETVTATVKVQISPGTPNGLVIDNLAGASAENADGDTAAISIGTPPLAPPSFRSR